MNNQFSRAIPPERIESYNQKHIRSRLAASLDNRPLEDVIDSKYIADVLECLDILEIGYPVTAIGIIGRALEGCIREYCNKKIQRKTDFFTNTNGYGIAKIRKMFWLSNDVSHDDRLKLLNQQVVSKRGCDYKLKEKLIKDDRFYQLISIKNARNDAFHGCDEDKQGELEALALNHIEIGITILINLLKSINE